MSILQIVNTAVLFISLQICRRLIADLKEIELVSINRKYIGSLCSFLWGHHRLLFHFVLLEGKENCHVNNATMTMLDEKSM